MGSESRSKDHKTKLFLPPSLDPCSYIRAVHLAWHRFAAEQYLRQPGWDTTLPPKTELLCSISNSNHSKHLLGVRSKWLGCAFSQSPVCWGCVWLWGSRSFCVALAGCKGAWKVTDVRVAPEGAQSPLRPPGRPAATARPRTKVCLPAPHSTSTNKRPEVNPTRKPTRPSP